MSVLAAKGGVLTCEYIRGVETGVRAAMSHGLLGGHPVIDVRVVLVDGSTHVNDSSELAFSIAGGKAFNEVPVAETFGYASALGGMTHGRGPFTLERARYAAV